MNKKLLLTLSLLFSILIVGCKSAENPAEAPLANSDFVGNWFEEPAQAPYPTFTIKSDGGIDLKRPEDGTVLASVAGSDVKKTGDKSFEATFKSGGEEEKVTFVFSSSNSGTFSNQEGPRSFTKK